MDLPTFPNWAAWVAFAISVVTLPVTLTPAARKLYDRAFALNKQLSMYRAMQVGRNLIKAEHYFNTPTELISRSAFIIYTAIMYYTACVAIMVLTTYISINHSEFKYFHIFGYISSLKINIIGFFLGFLLSIPHFHIYLEMNFIYKLRYKSGYRFHELRRIENLLQKGGVDDSKIKEFISAMIYNTALGARQNTGNPFVKWGTPYARHKYRNYILNGHEEIKSPFI